MKKHLPSRSRTRRTILLQLALIIGVAISAIALQSYAASVFVQPSSAPPGGNALAPLNVGGNQQTRVGRLIIKNGLLLNTVGAPYGLIVANGNVGIGTTNPISKLDVAGDINIETGKAYSVGGANILSSNGNDIIVGIGNKNNGNLSSSIGMYNTILSGGSSAFGEYNLSRGGLSFGFDNNSSDYSSAFGINNVSSNWKSSAFGAQNLALGVNSSAFGYGNYITVIGVNSSAFGYRNYVTGWNSSAFGSGITNNDYNSTMIGPSNVAKITIRSSGNVGIGTTNPKGKLDVRGSICLNGICRTTLDCRVCLSGYWDSKSQFRGKSCTPYASQGGGTSKKVYTTRGNSGWTAISLECR